MTWIPGQEDTRASASGLRIVVESLPTGVEATLWIDGCPVEGHSDRTGTISTQALLDPLLRRFESAR